jgi:hypothetical protein
MKSVEERRKEAQAQRQAERQRRKRAKTPTIVPVQIGEFEVNIPLFDLYAPILQRAEDTRLLDIATKYDIPLTQEQAFLVQEGDTFLPQFEKVQLSEERQVELMQQDWSPLQSSNIAAVKIDGADLLILFHSGDVYRYPDKAEMYYPFNEALSPGRLLHRTIRFVRGYRKEA